MSCCERAAWTGAVLALLAALAWCAIHEPLLPNEDDCRARRQPPDCWKLYDAHGRRVR